MYAHSKKVLQKRTFSRASSCRTGCGRAPFPFHVHVHVRVRARVRKTDEKESAYESPPRCSMSPIRCCSMTRTTNRCLSCCFRLAAQACASFVWRGLQLQRITQFRTCTVLLCTRISVGLYKVHYRTEYTLWRISVFKIILNNNQNLYKNLTSKLL